MRRRMIMKVRRRRMRMNMRRKMRMKSKMRRTRRRTSTMRIWASGHGIESTASPLVRNCTSIASNGREK